MSIAQITSNVSDWPLISARYNGLPVWNYYSTYYLFARYATTVVNVKVHCSFSFLVFSLISCSVLCNNYFNTLFYSNDGY